MSEMSQVYMYLCIPHPLEMYEDIFPCKDPHENNTHFENYFTKVLYLLSGIPSHVIVQGEDIWWFEQYSWALFKV